MLRLVLGLLENVVIQRPPLKVATDIMRSRTVELLLFIHHSEPELAEDVFPVVVGHVESLFVMVD